MTCTEEVLFAEIEILNTIVKGLFNNETREEILSKSPVVVRLVNQLGQLGPSLITSETL